MLNDKYLGKNILINNIKYDICFNIIFNTNNDM